MKLWSNFGGPQRLAKPSSVGDVDQSEKSTTLESRTVRFCSGQAKCKGVGRTIAVGLPPLKKDSQNRGSGVGVTTTEALSFRFCRNRNRHSKANVTATQARANSILDGF